MPIDIMPFAGGPFDHDETGRDLDVLQKKVQSPDAQCIMLYDGKPALDSKGGLVSVNPSALIGKNLLDPGPIYLGLNNGAPLFAATLQFASDAEDSEEFESLRSIGSRMNPVELAIAGRAKSLFDWHKTHRFCANCSAGTRADQGGIKRVCETCKTEHFPRVNPVVIMLVVHEGKCLLGHSANWPDGFYSTLAGFVSPGETIDEACIREVWEEVGVKVRDVKYLMSQPWPFPSQLMMGMICEADDTTLNINKAEIEEAKWFSKETVRGVLAKTDDSFNCPPRIAIAHHLLKWWADQ